MKVILYGASGMIGQGALRECLSDPDVTEVLCVVRTPLGVAHPKVKELVRKDLHDTTGLEEELAGYDACLWCLGVSASGMSEEAYTRVTYDLTVSAAKAMLAANPAMSIVFISGAGTDATGKSRQMWARVKGRAENALLGMPFKGAWMFRPGFIEPLDGIRSRTPLYNTLYRFTWPVFSVMKLFLGRHMLTTRSLGKAMLKAARVGAPKRVMEAADINAFVAP